MSDNFSRGFWRRAGQNTADRLSNAVFGDNWARPVKHIRAETASRRQRLAEEAQLNSIHSAVLSNADSVRGISFDDDIAELVEQLHDMSIQLKAEGWKSIIGVDSDNENQGKENRMRNQFTDTLFAKYKRGLTLLERQDPFNRDVWYLKWVRYTSGWRKIFGKYWFFLLVFGGVLIAFIAWGVSSFTEWYDYQVDYYNTLNLVIFWSGIVLVVLARIYYAFFHQINALFSRAHQKRKAKQQVAKRVEQTQAETESPTTEDEVIEEDTEQPIDPNTIMQTEHDYLWDRYGEANDIMKRGYSICKNTEHKDILIVGYNPTFKKGDNIGNQTPYALPVNDVINRLLVSPQTNLRDRAAYIDLFSFRESNREKANQQVVLNPQLFSYAVEQVCLTQNMIEELIQPKLIVVLDTDSWAYFGKLSEYTWMGYKYLSSTVFIKHEVFRIVDYVDKRDRINIEREQTNLKNTFVLFLDVNRKAEFPSPEDLLRLVK